MTYSLNDESALNSLISPQIGVNKKPQTQVALPLTNYSKSHALQLLQDFTRANPRRYQVDKQVYLTWVKSLGYYPDRSLFVQWHTERRSQARKKQLYSNLSVFFGTSLLGVAALVYLPKVAENLSMPSMGALPFMSSGPGLTERTNTSAAFAQDFTNEGRPSVTWLLPYNGKLFIKAPLDGVINKQKDCFSFHSPTLGTSFIRFCGVAPLEEGSVRKGQIISDASTKPVAFAIYQSEGLITQKPPKLSTIKNLRIDGDVDPHAFNAKQQAQGGNQ